MPSESTNIGAYVHRKEAFPEHEIAEYIRLQKRPGRLAAGLDYYKALGTSKEFFETAVAPPWGFPVLVVDGDHSMGGLTAKSFAQVQPDLKSLLAPECGHFVQEEQPEFLVGALLDFLPK